MAQRITIDPITRIEGHLRVDVEVEGGEVTKAWSSGQMYRGLENILKGRDPRDAWLFTSVSAVFVQPYMPSLQFEQLKTHLGLRFLSTPS